jgi:hypothetical protein
MTNERHLDQLFAQYRAACPDLETGPDFMPKLWARIEGRKSFSLVFERLGRMLVTASALACLVLAALNLVPAVTASGARSGFATYTDALSADTTLERTYHSESTPPPDMFPADFRQ